jgi:hypothetical protein
MTIPRQWLKNLWEIVVVVDLGVPEGHFPFVNADGQGKIWESWVLNFKISILLLAWSELGSGFIMGNKSPVFGGSDKSWMSGNITPSLVRVLSSPTRVAT